MKEYKTYEILIDLSMRTLELAASLDEFLEDKTMSFELLEMDNVRFYLLRLSVDCSVIDLMTSFLKDGESFNRVSSYFGQCLDCIKKHEIKTFRSLLNDLMDELYIVYGKLVGYLLDK